MDISFPRRKRGRPPKITKSSCLLELDFPTPHLPDSNSKQIQFGYRILQDILKFSKTRHLVEQPDETLFGLHDYYTVIQKPLWFNEILRKFNDQEYMVLNEVLSDIRLVLENCYKFWGPKHRFSKQAFRIEKLVERELQNIPQNIREMCSIDIPEEEPSTNSENEGSFLVDDFNSKILKSLEKKEKEELLMRNEMDTEKKLDLHKWESEVLEIKNHHKHIVYMAELAEIGHFLALSHDVLSLKTISQFEIERMLLMPKESTTLATIMTALLCPSALRGSLYFKPIMVYEVWSKFLSRKVDSWYNNYTKIGNKTQMFIRYGIETPFWEEVGEANPLAGTDYSEISFMKRVWILKTLCTTIFQSFKKIEEYFNSVDDGCLRGPVVYEDGKFEYISLFQPEIRVYRICRSEMDIDSKGEAIAIIPVKHGFPPDIQIQGENCSNVLKNLNKKNKFHLAAYDTASLTSLIKVCSQRKKSLSALRSLLTSCGASENKTLEALWSMKNQWDKFKERSQIIVNNSMKYWIEKEMSPPATPDDNSLQLLNFTFRGEGESSTSSDLSGKRQMKRKFSLDELEMSSDSSIDLNKVEEDTSDWEEGNIRRKVGKRKFRWPKWEEPPGEDLLQVRGNVQGLSARAPPASVAPFQPPVINPAFQLQQQVLLHQQEPTMPMPTSQQEWSAAEEDSQDPLALTPPEQPLHQTDSSLPSLLNNPPLYDVSPLNPPYRPNPPRRPYYRRGRGRGPRMRYFTPVRKLVRRPNIVASEITPMEMTGEEGALTISFSQQPTQRCIPVTIPPLPKLEILDSDLLLSDLQSIKLDPWLQIAKQNGSIQGNKKEQIQFYTTYV